MLDEEDSPFKRYRGPEISYRTKGFIGFGAIGARVKHPLNGFDMNFLVYDPYLPAEIAEKEGVKLCSLDEVLAGSDFVSVHCAVTPQTTGMIGAEEFKKMKPTAYFINTSRSGLVDEKALWQALKDHKIMGAALDVYDREPPGKDYPLVTLDNVTLSPHMAGGSRDAFTQSPGMLAREMLSFPEDKTSRFLVNPDVL